MKDLEAVLEGLGEQVGLIALCGVSNATGAELDIEKVVEWKNKWARRARVLIDGAQLAPHKKINFGAWGVDFLCYSGHKMYGPMGIGGLLVRREIVEGLQPFMVGGGMISEVSLKKTEYADVPDRFDAGTPNVAGAVGLSAACDYLEKLGMNEVEKHGRELVSYAWDKLSNLEKVKLVGPDPKSDAPAYVKATAGKRISKQISAYAQTSLALGRASKASADRQNSKSQIAKANRLGSVAFIYKGVHAHDVAQVLDAEGIAVRSGHHCTMPLHSKFNWVATTRASFGIYNDRDDVDALVAGLAKVEKTFGR